MCVNPTEMAKFAFRCNKNGWICKIINIFYYSLVIFLQEITDMNKGLKNIFCSCNKVAMWTVASFQNVKEVWSYWWWCSLAYLLHHYLGVKIYYPCMGLLIAHVILSRGWGRENQIILSCNLRVVNEQSHQ